ncbi:transcriptional regulator family: Forkhead [Agaricus bisporus var. burnettii]|uniref:Transcriptional regulator family: Forkhead n=1 Tax=Agaricus bisporus var. burnettii TaxID=192524 RepID=A0A8H7F3X8_AGABI|nr:transcriptional regulator family: Forkhead [Agaricus bisporus var. burnettii]
MDTRTHSASPRPDDHLPREPSPPPQDKISAYYSLVFPGWTFYIQMLSITIGRRCAPNANAPTSSTAEQAAVDVDLGNLRSVSRLHAKIEYDQEEDRFVLVVIGRNGAWVDGVWCGAGSRATLGERSHIQIASRTFTFVLPPPSPPEDTPSPSSQSSANRARSPSVDITSISPPSSQPSNSPPPRKVKLPPPSPEPQIDILQDHDAPERPELPNSNSIGKGKGAISKKRKKGDVDPLPLKRPDVMPPKPPFTYAQLIHRAIKDIDGKATLQEICNWIITNHDYYKYADSAWMSSVRHNLSSNRAFMKMERCGGDRGKGFFWSIDGKYAQNLEEQENRALQNGSQAGTQDGLGKPGKRKDKSTNLEPPLKRSIKGEPKGPLPPPLTSAPLIPKSTSSANTNTNPNPNAATGVFSYNAQAHASSSVQPQRSTTHPANPTNPYAALAHVNWNPQSSSSSTITKAMTSIPVQPHSITPPLNSSTTSTSTVTPSAPTSTKPILPPINTNSVPDVVLPIVLGPIPSTHPDYVPDHPNNSAKVGYMILHERKLILDPDVFSGLTSEMLKELEKMGAMAAVKVLTAHMVRALKERRAKTKIKDKSAKKAAKAAKKAAAATTSAIAESNNTILSEPASIAVANASPDGTIVDPGSPIIIIDDSEDEGPASKRRKLNDGGTSTIEMAPVAV